MFWLLLFSPASLSADSGYGEYEIKAAFLYNFTKFVDWPSPEDPYNGKPFTIGILGEDPFGPALEAIAKEQIDGRPVKICHFRKFEALDTCQVLYISRSEQRKLPTILRKLAERPVLTVSDIPEFARQGGMIGFVMQGRNVRFEINYKKALKSGLQISSHLLGLALEVYRSP